MIKNIEEERIKCPNCNIGINSPCEFCDCHWNYFEVKESLEKQNLQKQVEKVFDELDSDLVCIDFKRNLTKKDYQIITTFFDKINKARKKLGLKIIKHSR